MTTLYHIFRCYADDVSDSVEVTAPNECEAQGIAAGMRCWRRSRIVARYVRTTGDQPYDARDAELRKAMEGVMPIITSETDAQKICQSCAALCPVVRRKHYETYTIDNISVTLAFDADVCAECFEVIFNERRDSAIIQKCMELSDAIKEAQ
jgi:hypothetical protein